MAIFLLSLIYQKTKTLIKKETILSVVLNILEVCLSTFPDFLLIHLTEFQSTSQRIVSFQIRESEWLDVAFEHVLYLEEATRCNHWILTHLVKHIMS